MVGNIEETGRPLLPIDFEVGDDLFEGNLEGITDIMEQSSQPPELQEEGCSGRTVIRIKRIEIDKCFPEISIHLINRQTKGKDIDRVRVMIPVLHEQGGSIGFELGEKLHHALGTAVFANEHFQVSIINGIGIFRHAGIDELAEFIFQAEPVDIHLHIVGNLVRAERSAKVLTGLLFLLFLFSAEAQTHAAFFQKTKGSRLKVCACFFVGE